MSKQYEGQYPTRGQRDLLEALVRELNDCNSSEQLNGYLDYLAREFNRDLAGWGLPLLEVCPTSDYSLEGELLEEE